MVGLTGQVKNNPGETKLRPGSLWLLELDAVRLQLDARSA
jgi:hypothetical protein